jgi:serine/threonine-protein kinase
MTESSPAQGPPNPEETVGLGGNRDLSPAGDPHLTELDIHPASAPSPQGPTPDPVARALEDPTRRVSCFVLVARIGSGGVAEVWKAWDLDLARWVALKRPLGLGSFPQVAARFQVEARAAARLDHPNIVPIYRVDEHQGQPFIVMRLIEGRTIGDAPLPTRRALEVVLAAARAVHYAHQQGIVHRDLKPANLMIDEEDRVWVFDFGLAHLVESSRALTTIGTVVGTPAFMSPEQAQGDPRSREPATDVYSLGATLYTLITGRLPFEGESAAAIVGKVRDLDPLPPRHHKANLPRDVETIILKAMEKRPERRYPSAAELAEDIRRYLEGEAIVAKPLSLLDRSLRFIGRRPGAAALSALVLLVSGFALGVLLPALRDERHLRQDAQSRERAARDESLEALRRLAVKSSETILSGRRKGLSVKLVADTLDSLLVQAYQEATRQSPGLAEADYLMGRLERARMRDDSAEAYQDRALAKQPAYGPALYERVVLLSRKFFVGLDRERARAGRTRAKRDEIVRTSAGLSELAERAQAAAQALSAALRTPSDSYVQLSDAAILCARGIVEAWLGDASRARPLLVEAVGKDPTLEEAFETLAAISDSASEIIDWYTRGLEHDAGYLGHLIGRASCRERLAIAASTRGQDPGDAWIAAEQDLTKAVELEPDLAHPRLGLSNLRILRAEVNLMAARDPRADLDLAERDLEQVRRADPRCAPAWLGLARIHRIRALNGGDKQDIARAREAAGRAVELTPEDRDVWHILGAVDHDLAKLEMKAGHDPSRELQTGLEALSRSIELDEDNFFAWWERGCVYLSQARLRIHKAEDPLRAMESAETDLTRAIELIPEHPCSRMFRGMVRGERALWRAGRGEDCSEDLRGAEEDFDRAIRLGPSDPRPWFDRATLRGRFGQFEAARGHDPQEEFRRAESDYGRGLELSPDHPEGLMNRGLMNLVWAQYLFRARRDSVPRCLRAEEDFTRLIEAGGPVRARALVSRAMARNSRANESFRKGRIPVDEIRSAETDLTEALRLEPKNASAWVARGDLRFNVALFHEQSGDPARARSSYAGAADDYEGAAAVDPASVRNVLDRMKTARSKGPREY